MTDEELKRTIMEQYGLTHADIAEAEEILEMDKSLAEKNRRTRTSLGAIILILIPTFMISVQIAAYPMAAVSVLAFAVCVYLLKTQAKDVIRANQSVVRDKPDCLRLLKSYQEYKSDLYFARKKRDPHKNFKRQ